MDKKFDYFTPNRSLKDKIIHPDHNIKIFYIITSIILIITIFLIALSNSKENCNNNQDCFIKNAKECIDSTYESNINGTLIKHETQGCTLTKTVTKIGPNEPDEIKAMFFKKSMTCSYTKETFNVDLITSLSGSLELCEGPLKTSINDILIAEYKI